MIQRKDIRAEILVDLLPHRVCRVFFVLRIVDVVDIIDRPRLLQDRLHGIECAFIVIFDCFECFALQDRQLSGAVPCKQTVDGADKIFDLCCRLVFLLRKVLLQVVEHGSKIVIG